MSCTFAWNFEKVRKLACPSVNLIHALVPWLLLARVQGLPADALIKTHDPLSALVEQKASNTYTDALFPALHANNSPVLTPSQALAQATRAEVDAIRCIAQ